MKAPTDNNQTSQSSSLWEVYFDRMTDEIVVRYAGKVVKITRSEFMSKLKESLKYPYNFTDQDCIETILDITKTK